MGIPRFASWISKKYPKMVLRETPGTTQGLYIDMNGVIHPCCHGDSPATNGRTQQQMLDAICNAIAELVEMVQPTEIVYLAMDGVAPRAKMNQQRARRYMSALEKYSTESKFGLAPREDGFTEEDHRETETHLTEALNSVDFGIYGPPPDAEEMGSVHSPTAMSEDDFFPRISSSHQLYGFDEQPGHPTSCEDPDPNVVPEFDSNCISPGTEFMALVATTVTKFIAHKVATDASWQNRAVILSDTSVPGEGEHKLIQFLRSQTSRKDWCNGNHMIFGLDADLILLCLSLHTTHIYIMRDHSRRFSGQTATPAANAEKEGADAVAAIEDVEGEAEDASSSPPSPTKAPRKDKGSDPKGGHGGRRGRRGGRDFEWYDITLVGACIVAEMSEIYKGIFGKPIKYLEIGGSASLVSDFIAMASLMGNDFLPRVPSAFAGESSMDNLMEVYLRNVLPHGPLTQKAEIVPEQLLRLLQGYAKIETMLIRKQEVKAGTMSEALASAPLYTDVDKGWRNRYYTSVNMRKQETIDAVCTNYLKGLRFVWRYYAEGTPSWSWYFPFNHAPLAQDLAEHCAKMLASSARDTFSEPFPNDKCVPPLEQLFAIMPPTSINLLPEPLRPLMFTEELRDMFPLSWKVDFAASGNKEHLATILLPFVNMKAIHDMTEKYTSLLDPIDESRNVNRDYHDVIVSASHPLASTDDVVRQRFMCGAFSDGDSPSEAGSRCLRFTDVPPEPRRPMAYPTKKLMSSITLPTSVSPADFVFCVGCAVILGMWLQGASVVSLAPLVSAFIAAVVIMLRLGLGTWATKPGSGINRNSVRETNVDWMCLDSCLSLNFQRNDMCFRCEHPYSLEKCWTVFSSRQSQTPPNLEMDHTPYVNDVRITLPPSCAVYK